MDKHWQILQPDPHLVQNLCTHLHCTSVTASVLANRNITTVNEALRFLKPSMQQLQPPCSLKDMDVAVERIEKAIQRNEKILIFGDYDVDGVTATAVLFEFFQKAGADVSFYIPHRFTEGYSLQVHHISDYAAANQIALVITADCGSGSHEAVRAAQKAGIDVIITDHHRVSDTLPDALAVINPQRPDCTAGFEHLAGVGVALSLIICLRKHLRENGFWQRRPEPNLRELCDLVALGTVADAVSLTDDNRIFTRVGLEVIRAGQNRPGIVELLKICGANPRTVNAEDIAFRIAPRLNAAGRMDHAKQAIKLLMTESADEAKRLALSLDSLNLERKNTENKMLKEILGYLHEQPGELNKKALVLAGNHWHEGVLGIVASRLVDKFFRPVVVISTRGETGMGKGSARSVAGFNLYRGLAVCSDQLENFGGHTMAAGLQIKNENIPHFREKFETAVRQETGDNAFVAKVFIDYEIQFNEITDRIIDEIEVLQPFGAGNPEPLFSARDIHVRQSRIVGKHHRRMLLYQPAAGTDCTFSAIAFNVNTHRPLRESFDRIAFRLHWNYWNGRKTAQMVIEETE